MNKKSVRKIQVALVVVFFLVFAGLALLLRNDLKKTQIEPVEQEVVETISTDESVKEKEEEQSTLAEELITPIDWESGILVGQWGENESTKLLMSDSNTYGTVSDFLTFQDEETGHAYVIAGTREDKGIVGSLWRVNKPDIDIIGVSLVKQLIRIDADTANYLIYNNCKYLVLNYEEEEEINGQILAFPITEQDEILEGIPGRKVILPDCQIRCEGEETYLFNCFSDGSIRATDGKSYTDTEYVREWVEPLEEENPDIYGKPMQLSEEHKFIINGLVLDCSENWDNHPEDVGSGSSSYLKEQYRRIYVINKTENFILYGTKTIGEMIAKTPEGTYVSMPGAFSSNYNVQPEVLEADFDKDGSLELAIKVLTQHGTGVCVEQLFMVDKHSDGHWYTYELSNEWYNGQLSTHIQSNYTEKGLELLFDGESQGVFEDIENDPTSAYYTGSQIDFSFEDGELRLIAELVIYSDTNFSGTGYFDQLVMTLAYQGEGKWQEEDCQFVLNEESRKQYAQWKEEKISPIAESLEEIKETLTASQMYAELTFMDGNTGVSMLLVAEKENVDSNNHTAGACRVYALLEDGVHDFDYIYGDGTQHPIKYDETGFYTVRPGHVSVHAPSIEEKMFVTVASAEEIDNGQGGYTWKALVDGDYITVDNNVEIERLKTVYREAEAVKFQAK